jgi:hypothetical protein
MLFVGDLLQLPPVVQNMDMPVSRRMITRIACWAQIHKLRLREKHRSENLPRLNFMIQVANGSTDHIKLWSQVRDQFHVHVTQSTDDALAFCLKISDRWTDSPLIALRSPHKSTSWGD